MSISALPIRGDHLQLSFSIRCKRSETLALHLFFKLYHRCLCGQSGRRGAAYPIDQMLAPPDEEEVIAAIVDVQSGAQHDSSNSAPPMPVPVLASVPAHELRRQIFMARDE
jgi:hypothetical protein